jgi:hypothetical protein
MYPAQARLRLVPKHMTRQKAVLSPLGSVRFGAQSRNSAKTSFHRVISTDRSVNIALGHNPALRARLLHDLEVYDY